MEYDWCIVIPGEDPGIEENIEERIEYFDWLCKIAEEE
jgi:hypothetical protein